MRVLFRVASLRVKWAAGEVPVVRVLFRRPFPEPDRRSGRPPARSLLWAGPFPTAPRRTGRARFPWHPALQCSSWLPCGTSGVDVLVAVAAEDQGLAAAGGHPHDPFRWVLAALGIEVLQSAHVVHLHLFSRPA